MSGYVTLSYNEYVTVSPTSGSVDDNTPIVVPIGTFSDIDDALNSISVGGSFTSVTLIVNVPSYVKPPASVVLTLIVYEDLASKSNITAFFNIPPLDNVKLLLSGKDILSIKVYVNVSPASTSNVVNVPIVVPITVFSCCESLSIVKPYGASFTSKIFVSLIKYLLPVIFHQVSLKDC